MIRPVMRNGARVQASAAQLTETIDLIRSNLSP